MAIEIEERFVVRAPPARVWAYLVDPHQVVTCLPGAELTEVVNDREFQGNVKVKVGPVTVAYRGRVRMVELDQAGGRVRMTAEGRETGGAGSAKMSMESVLAGLAGGGTEVVVRAQVDIAGRLVQLGRGMIEQVSHQLFAQFAECSRAKLEAEPAAVTTAAALPEEARPVSAIPLMLRALAATIAAFFRRLFGRARR